jgi:hypothetical protein
MGEVRQIYPSGHSKWLPDGTSLWRYVSLQTLFFYLNQNIFLPSIAKLRQEDPFEGESPNGDIAEFKTAFKHRYGERARELENWIHKNLCSPADKEQIQHNGWDSDGAAYVFVRHYFDFLRKTRFAWCWFKSEIESEAMWKTYGKIGVAVATEVGKLRKVLAATERDFVFGQMLYGESTRRLAMSSKLAKGADFLLRSYFLKRLEYKHEEEVRFVTAGPPTEPKAGILLRNVTAADWITKVRLWPKLTLEEEESLKETLHRSIKGLDCRCSGLHGRNWPGEEPWEKFVQKHQERNDSSWRDCSDGIPREIKNL